MSAQKYLEQIKYMEQTAAPQFTKEILNGRTFTQMVID